MVCGIAVHDDRQGIDLWFHEVLGRRVVEGRYRAKLGSEAWCLLCAILTWFDCLPSRSVSELESDATRSESIMMKMMEN